MNQDQPVVPPSVETPIPRLVALVGGVLASSLLMAEPAAAHTGLGTDDAADGLLHPFLGIDHLLAMVAVGVLAASARDRRVAWLTPIGFVVGMIAGGMLGIGGVGLPGAEVVIALSVIVLGVLIATVTHHAGWWLPLLAVAFGVAHGHAHGAELPADAIPVAYALGFVLATAALHLAGTAIGVGLRRAPRARGIAAALFSSVGVALLLSL